MDIKPNNFCPCGSGEKYKKCCMNHGDGKDTNIFKGFFEEYPLEKRDDGGLLGFSSIMPFYNFKLPKSSALIAAHAGMIGSKPYILSMVEEMIEYIDIKHDEGIKGVCLNFLCIGDNDDFYYDILEKNQTFSSEALLLLRKRKIADKRIIASKPEIALCKRLAGAILLDYANLSKYNRLDYGAFLVCAEYTHKIISSGKIRCEYVNSLKVYILKNKIESWEITTTKENNTDKFIVEWIALNDIENFIEIYKTTLPGLDNLSHKALASLSETKKRHKESEYDNDTFFSYGQLAWGYFNIIERELNLIIDKGVKRKKNRSLYELYKYFSTNPLQNFAMSSDTLCQIIESLRPFRNDGFHGGEISKNAFNEIEKLINDSKLIEAISKAKCDLTILGN